MTSNFQALHPPPWGALSEARLDSLRVWQLMIGGGQLPRLAIQKDPTSQEAQFQSMLRDKTLRNGSMALALELPFDTLPACRQPRHPRSRKAVRRYLDALLQEASLIGQLLQHSRTVTHLYWLGDPSRWLSRAEMTELMYRLGQFFHLRQNLCGCATIEMEHWSMDGGLYALLRGLGFSHLLINTNQTEPDLPADSSRQLREYWECLHLTAVSPDPSGPPFTRFQLAGQASANPSLKACALEMMIGAPHDLMVGLGLGAWSVVDHRLIRNTVRLDTYYAKLAKNRLPSLETGTWNHGN